MVSVNMVISMPKSLQTRDRENRRPQEIPLSSNFDSSLWKYLFTSQSFVSNHYRHIEQWQQLGRIRHVYVWDISAQKAIMRHPQTRLIKWGLLGQNHTALSLSLQRNRSIADMRHHVNIQMIPRTVQSLTTIFNKKRPPQVISTAPPNILIGTMEAG